MGPSIGNVGQGAAWKGMVREVIREATGKRLDEFAQEHLFAPLAITNYEWDHINEDMLHASGNLKLRPRDMAKLGYLTV